MGRGNMFGAEAIEARRNEWRSECQSERRSLRRALVLIAALAVFAFAALALAGCAQQATDASSQSSSSQSSAAEDSATQPKTDVATPSTAGALQVKGAQLCAQDGSPVQLRGVSTHGLAWFPQYVNQQLFDELRSDWGANVVRLAMYTAESGGYCTGGDREQLYGLVRDGVGYAEQANLYAIVDWHILSDGNPLDHADDAADFFAHASADLAENDNVIYEICNEPNGNATWDDVKSYAERIIPVIRENDPDAVVIVGTPTWSQDVDKAAADPLDADNVMYALHFYAATHQKDLRDRMQAAVEGGLPVFVSEFGICDASGNGRIDYASADAWVQLMDSLDVSYVCWNLSNKDEASSLISASCDKVSGFDESDLSAEGKWLWAVLHGEEPAEGADGGAGSAASDDAGGQAGSASQSGQSEGSLPATLSGSNGSVSWQATLSNSWESDGKSFGQYSAVLTNNGGSATSGWQVSIPFDSAIELSDGWNGTYSVSGSTLNITNADYNATIAAASALTDIGFIISM